MVMKLSDRLLNNIPISTTTLHTFTSSMSCKSVECKSLRCHFCCTNLSVNRDKCNRVPYEEPLGVRWE